MRTDRTRKITLHAAAIILAALTAGIARAESTGTMERRILVGDDLSLAVPAIWETEDSSGTEGLRIRMKVCPITTVQEYFTVHTLDRGGSDEERWVSFHKTRNLPSAHADCAIDSESWDAVGSCKSWLMNVVHIPSRRGYGLLEALLFTESRVVIASYLYDLARGEQAGLEMDRIIHSFSRSPESADEARNWYDEGRTLGLERIGLFLRLPRAWKPRDERKQSNPAVVDLPSGGVLRVFAEKYLSHGLKDLKRSVGRTAPEWKCDAQHASISIGRSGKNALWVESAESKAATVLCLNGRGGFGLVLTTAEAEDRELLRRMTAQAVLLGPGNADAARREASKEFKAALRENDAPRASQALSTLELFSNRDSVVALVARGLRARGEIQNRCAASLGRIGSPAASRTLEKTLSDRRAAPPLRRSCIDALCLIGGTREITALKNVHKRLAASFPDDLRQTLQKSIEEHPAAQRKQGR